MKKMFITVLLFLLTLTVLALDIETFEPLLNKNIDVSQGVTLPPAKPFVWDFSNKYYWGNWLQIEPNLYIPIGPDGYLAPYNEWYMTDFAEEPFDGRLEIYVFGEPLPTPLTTLLVAFGTVGIIYMCKCKSSKVEKTLVVQ